MIDKSQTLGSVPFSEGERPLPYKRTTPKQYGEFLARKGKKKRKLRRR